MLQLEPLVDASKKSLISLTELSKSPRFGLLAPNCGFQSLGSKVGDFCSKFLGFLVSFPNFEVGGTSDQSKPQSAFSGKKIWSIIENEVLEPWRPWDAPFHHSCSVFPHPTDVNSLDSTFFSRGGIWNIPELELRMRVFWVKKWWFAGFLLSVWLLFNEVLALSFFRTGLFPIKNTFCCSKTSRQRRCAETRWS